jgi:hypothetical protein
MRCPAPRQAVVVEIVVIEIDRRFQCGQTLFMFDCYSAGVSPPAFVNRHRTMPLPTIGV